MRMNKHTRLIRDMGIFALGSLGSKLILFLMVPLYTNYMTTEQYGISDLVSTLAELLTPFVSLVIFDAVQRFALAKDECREDVLLAGLVVASAGAAVTLALTPLLSLYHPIAKWKWFLSVYVILTMFSNVEKNYLKAKDMNRLFASLSIVQTAALASCNVLFIARCGMGVFGYLLSTCIACLVPVVGPFLFGGLTHDLRVASLDWLLVRRMIGFSAPLVLNNVSWWAIHSFDKVLIESSIGASELGVYTVATKMPSMINVLTSIFSQAWGIASVREYESSNDNDYYATVAKTLSCVVFGITIGLVAIIRPFMSLYVGEAFSDAWRYVPLLLLSAALYSMGSYYGSLYGALKKSANVMVTTVLSAVTCVIITIVMVPHFYIWGAVVGTFVSYSVLLIVRSADIDWIIGIKTIDVSFCLTVILVTIQAIVVSFSRYGAAPFSAVTVALFCLINSRVLRKPFDVGR